MWKAVCFRELGLTKPENPPPLHEKAKLCANFREAWRAWRTEYAEFFQSTEQATVIRRAARCWNSIKGWLDEHAPQIAATLAPGVSKEEAAALTQLPDGEGSNSLELRALYRVHNGQRPELVPRTYDTASAGNWDGLLGGYSFYQHIINTRMMTLSEGIRLAQQLPGRDRASRSVVVAHSLILGRDAPEKLYSYSFKDAALSLQQASQPRGSYVPPTTGLLDWFEEYASLLSTDTFRIAPVLELPQTTGEPGINLYPITPPRFGEAVTHGVCVRAGSLFIPELSRPSEYWFSYSMRMHIPESSSSAAPPAGCQLLSRHLIFDKGVRGVPPQIVDGEAVIGMHPLLKVGEPEFVYQSCTSAPAAANWDYPPTVSGSFRFVPGSIENPTGPPFDVSIPLIELNMPKSFL